MKKSKLKDIIAGLDNFIRVNERLMQIQDNAILRKDKEITIANAAANELRVTLEETQEALRRSRNITNSLRQNMDSRSIKDMAKDLHGLYYGEIQEFRLDIDTESGLEHWMGLVVEILSGQKIGRG